MRGTFRRDLSLAPGPEFRLRRRPSARVYSALLAAAAIGWGTFDLFAGYRWVGLGTVVLAIASVAQLVQGELNAWRLTGAELRSRRLKIAVADIEGVHVEFAGRLARAWVETHGEPVALVEGDEQEVRRIAERLSATLSLAALPQQKVLH